MYLLLHLFFICTFFNISTTQNPDDEHEVYKKYIYLMNLQIHHSCLAILDAANKKIEDEKLPLRKILAGSILSDKQKITLYCRKTKNKIFNDIAYNKQIDKKTAQEFKESLYLKDSIYFINNRELQYLVHKAIEEDQEELILTFIGLGVIKAKEKVE